MQSDIRELDRLREDDPNNYLRWLADSIDRWLQRQRMLNARAMQTKRIQSGASLTTDNSASFSVALAQGKDKGQGKGKGKGKGKGNGQGDASDRSGGIGHIPSSTGVCVNFARHGKCDKDNCSFQRVSGAVAERVGGRLRAGR